MQRLQWICMFFLGMLFVACQKEKQTKHFMVDSWQTTYLQIKMPTHLNSDSTYVFIDQFDAKPQLLAQSHYKEDSTFTAWFLNEKGEKIAPSKGRWYVTQDSLFVHFLYNGRDMKLSYIIKETADGFTAKSQYDWDEDGSYDDVLTMKTKRIQLNN